MSNDDRASRTSQLALNDENLSPCSESSPVKTSLFSERLLKKSDSFFSERYSSSPSLTHRRPEPSSASLASSPTANPPNPNLRSPVQTLRASDGEQETSQVRQIFPASDVIAEILRPCLNEENNMAHCQSALGDESEEDLPPVASADDGLSVPPVEYEWRNIHSYNSLYKPDVFPFVTTLPTGRYGFMTPPVRPLCAGGASASILARGHSPRTASSLLVSPTESSLNSLELEAIAAVHELQFVVKDIFVSELLPRTSELIFLNVTTLEGQAYCIELTVKGWRVTSLRHDCMNGDYNRLDLHTSYYETIYALMDSISVGYRRKFHEALSTKLLALASGDSPTPTADAESSASSSAAFRRDENVHFTIDGDDKEA